MTAPHDRPDPMELLAAVRDFLLDDVVAATSGQVAFHARVAANAIGLVTRELASQPADAEAHAARLVGIGCVDDEDLAARIWAGEFDDRYDEMARVVRAAVWDKLQVANPKYAGEHSSAETRERA
jgi:hypothetical protein